MALAIPHSNPTAGRPSIGAAPGPDGPAGPDRLRWTGFGGTLLVTAAAWAGAAAPPAAALPLAAGVAGTGLLVLSWVLLALDVHRGRARPSGRWLTGTLALWCGPLLLAPPLFSRDLFSYLAQGEIAAAGLDPGAVGPAEALGPGSATAARVDVHWRDAPSPYGPVFGAVARTIARATAGDPVTGVLLHRLVAVAGLVLVVWAVPRLAAAAGAAPRHALLLGVLNPLVPWHAVGGGHNDALMLGLMLAGAAVALDALGGALRWGPFALGVGLVVLAAGVKLPALVALAVVGTALAHRWGGAVRHLLLAGAGAVLAVAVGAVAVRLLTGLGFGAPTLPGAAGGPDSWMAPTNWFGFLAGGIAGPAGARTTPTMIAVGEVAGCGIAVCGIAVVLLRQLRGRIGAVAALGRALALVVALGPVVQPWYLLWAVVPLAAAGPEGRRWTGLVAVVAVFAVLVPPSAGSFGGRVGELVVGYATGILLAAAVTVLVRRRRAGAGARG